MIERVFSLLVLLFLGILSFFACLFFFLVFGGLVVSFEFPSSAVICCML